MKRLLVLTALGLFLAAHDAAAPVTIYPRAAIADCGSSNC
jgi:hypothetical protein